VNQIVNLDNYDLHLVNCGFILATNKVREDKHLKPLKILPLNSEMLLLFTRSRWLKRNSFDHFNNKTPKLHSPEDRMILFGVKADAMGENIDLNNIELPSKTTYLQLADKIVDEWMHSAPHRKTMLSKAYSHLGCGAMFEESDKNGVRYIKSNAGLFFRKNKKAASFYECGFYLAIYLEVGNFGITGSRAVVVIPFYFITISTATTVHNIAMLVNTTSSGNRKIVGSTGVFALSRSPPSAGSSRFPWRNHFGGKVGAKRVTPHESIVFPDIVVSPFTVAVNC